MSQFNDASIPSILELARKHFADGELPQTYSLCRQVLAIEPQQPIALHLMAQMARRGGRPDLAEQFLTQSVQSDPQNAQTHQDLGGVLLANGRHPQAIAAYRRAIELRPDFAEAFTDLGIALALTGQFAASIPALQRAVVIKPDLAVAHDALGTCLRHLGQAEQAIIEHRKAIELQPNFSAAHSNLALDLSELGHAEQTVAALRQALKIAPSFRDAHINLIYAMHFLPHYDAFAIFQEHQAWNRAHAQPLAVLQKPHSNDRNPDRRLRVGYVSADFRQHSVSFFIEPLLIGHNPERVEVFCYADMVNPDEVTVRLKSAVANWRDITSRSDDDLDQIIRADQIDILIDLAGHTGGSRLLVFARKPAPIQATYLGYIDTTGLTAIDYRLTDAIADPPGLSEQFHSEQLVRFPRTFACYRPPSDAPPVNPLPALSNGFVTFASFTTVQKINEPLLDCWAEVLSSVPDSRLIIAAKGLHYPTLEQSIRIVFERRGIASSRLTLLDHQGFASYFAAHHRADLILDTFPVNGHTVTCHALWMGLPCISLAGSTYCQRLGASVLSNLRLTELIAQTPQQYARAAIKLANDLPRLADLRANLRQRLAASPLMDTGQFAQDVEDAYRTMWRRWCDEP